MSPNYTYVDGVFQVSGAHQAHENRLYVAKTQTNEDAILADNAEKRKQTQRKMGWGKQLASIPQIMYDSWCRANPELRSGDRQIRSRKLLELIKANPQVMVASD